MRRPKKNSFCVPVAILPLQSNDFLLMAAARASGGTVRRLLLVVTSLYLCLDSTNKSRSMVSVVVSVLQGAGGRGYIDVVCDVRGFTFREHSGTGQFLTSVTKHLLFASADHKCTLDLHTSVLGMCWWRRCANRIVVVV